MIMRLFTAGLEEQSIMDCMGMGKEFFPIIFDIKRKLSVSTVQQAVYRIAKSKEFRAVPPLPHEIHCYRHYDAPPA